MKNIILMTDSYKASHYLQYPPGTEYVSSYIESRGGRWDVALFFGLQMFLKEYLTRPITQENIDEAAEFFSAHGEPFNTDGWQYILNEHKGFLPVEIEAVPEGTVVNTKNVLVQIVNTDPECYWLTSYLETALLRAVWYPTTVATNSFSAKADIWKALQESSDDPAGQIAFKLHDFGGRGVNTSEGADVGGAAHLVNFMGTDTVEGVVAVRKHYGENMAGFSIPAAEHSTMTSWGGEAGEMDAVRNMLKQFAKPGAMVAIVSDSYDIWKLIEKGYGDELKQEIIDSGATVIVRPDSGDPLTVPVAVVERLWEAFGGEVNSKGYKVLHPCVRVIQGDGITSETIGLILNNLLAAGFSADNLAFGQGGGLLQQVDRDTLKFAMKCSAIKLDNEIGWRDVYKEPVDQPDKKSKKGILALIEGEDGRFTTVRKDDPAYSGRNRLEVVYRNGKLLKNQMFSDIRERASVSFT